MLNFIQRYNKCSFGRAVEILKEYANISEDYVDTRLAATKAIKQFKLPVRKAPTAVNRKSLPPDIMNQYELDYGKLQLWIDEGISPEVLEKYQVRYDPFSNRLLFPVRDNSGNIIALKGRTLDPDFKTKKIPKYTHLQSIDYMDFFFGYYDHLEAIKAAKEVIIFEGEKSVMLTETWGIKNTVALTTSHLNPLQFKQLVTLGVRVVFALDKGVNVYKDENIMRLKRYVEVEYIKDKGSLIDEKEAPVDRGKDVWIELYEGRRKLN